MAATDTSTGCTTVHEYYPPYFTNANAGDAILYPRGTCADTDGVCQLFAAIGLQYTHVALAYDNGSDLAETYWDLNPPPSTQSTGGSHACSRILDSAKLQSLNPGTNGGATADYNRIVNWAQIVPAMGTPYCNAPSDKYHFNSFIHDDVMGGSCEKFVVDYCGVPVQPQDKVVLSGDQLNMGLTAVYKYAYNGAYGTTSNLPWYDYTFCGGVDATIMAQRAAMQVTNEIRWKWWELRMPDGDSTDTLGIDTNAEGITVQAPGGYAMWEDLGAGSQNTQWTGDPDHPNANSTFGSYCTNVNISYQTPDGNLYGQSANCPSWSNYGNPVTANVPDNVANAATRMQLAFNGAQVQAGYWKYETYCN